LRKTSVKILIWGPGEGTNFYSKRDRIKQHLRDIGQYDEVNTSEDLFKSIEHPSFPDLVQLELLHANVADIIFGLVTSDPRQTGIYMEIDNLLRYEPLINKTWLIMPDEHDWHKAGSFIQVPLLNSFPMYRTKSFRIKQLEKCEQVRKFCSDKVNETRARLMRNYVQKVLSGQDNS